MCEFGKKENGTFRIDSVVVSRHMCTATNKVAGTTRRTEGSFSHSEDSASAPHMALIPDCSGNSCPLNKTHIKIQSKCAYLLLGQGTGELISREALHDQLTIQRQTNRDSTTTLRPTRAKSRHILNWLKMASGYGMNGGKSVLGSADTKIHNTSSRRLTTSTLAL